MLRFAGPRRVRISGVTVRRTQRGASRSRTHPGRTAPAFGGRTSSQHQRSQPLDRGQVLGVDLQRRRVGRDGFIRLSRAFQGQCQVDGRIGMAGHQLAGPFELTRRVVQLAALQVQDSEVVVGRAKEEVVAERLAKQSLRPLGVGGRGATGP